MQTLFQQLLTTYLEKLDQIGIPGVTVMMMLFFPGELVIPPASYTEVYKVSQGNVMVAIGLALLVILAGAVGFYISVAALFWIARGVGRPLILKCGKYCLISERKLQLAEHWIKHYGAASVLFSALLPGIRHVICIPAGIAGMRFRTFSLMSFLGGFLWCTVLTIFGLVMSKDMAVIVRRGVAVETISIHDAMRNLTLASMTLALLVTTLYFLVVYRQSHTLPHTETSPVAPEAAEAECGQVRS